ncbi:MAG: hypothetical protein U5N86_09190 [Planctomycetota bacterium]|nr:hypothetical protein [Planctomycetota bacterium]
MTPEQLPYAVDVFLGVYGEGRAAFDSLDLVRGEPRGGDLGRAAMLAGIVLLFYAAAIALLELFSAKLSKPEPPAPYEMEK